VRIAPFSVVQSRDRTPVRRCDGEIRRIRDERAIAGIPNGSTCAPNSDRNASISGDAYMREKSLFM
jgi:hypothetical protein